MRKAIVTGGAGFIGQALVRRLNAEGFAALIIDDFSTHLTPAYDAMVISADSRLSICDVRDFRLPLNWYDAEVIFHLAGKVGPVGVLSHAGRIAEDTITMAAKVGDWASTLRCPLVFISTSEVYGTPDEANAEDAPTVITAPTVRSEYAVGKLAAEHMLFNRDIDVRVVRPFNITGAGQREEGGFVLPRFIRQALDDDDLTVYSPGTQDRSFTDIRDFIDGLMLVWRGGLDKEVYNLGNENNRMSILDTAKRVIYVIGRGRIAMVDPLKLHGPKFREAVGKIPNSTKARRELGFDPKVDVDGIIMSMVARQIRGEWGL